LYRPCQEIQLFFINLHAVKKIVNQLLKQNNKNNTKKGRPQARWKIERDDEKLEAYVQQWTVDNDDDDEIALKRLKRCRQFIDFPLQSC
jgi:hypothetical protein